MVKVIEEAHQEGQPLSDENSLTDNDSAFEKNNSENTGQEIAEKALDSMSEEAKAERTDLNPSQATRLLEEGRISELKQLVGYPNDLLLDEKLSLVEQAYYSQHEVKIGYLKEAIQVYDCLEADLGQEAHEILKTSGLLEASLSSSQKQAFRSAYTLVSGFNSAFALGIADTTTIREYKKIEILEQLEYQKGISIAASLDERAELAFETLLNRSDAESYAHRVLWSAYKDLEPEQTRKLTDKINHLVELKSPSKDYAAMCHERFEDNKHYQKHALRLPNRLPYEELALSLIATLSNPHIEAEQALRVVNDAEHSLFENEEAFVDLVLDYIDEKNSKVAHQRYAKSDAGADVIRAREFKVLRSTMNRLLNEDFSKVNYHGLNGIAHRLEGKTYEELLENKCGILFTEKERARVRTHPPRTPEILADERDFVEKLKKIGPLVSKKDIDDLNRAVKALDEDVSAAKEIIEDLPFTFVERSAESMNNRVVKVKEDTGEQVKEAIEDTKVADENLKALPQRMIRLKIINELPDMISGGHRRVAVRQINQLIGNNQKGELASLKRDYLKMHGLKETEKFEQFLNDNKIGRQAKSP